VPGIVQFAKAVIPETVIEGERAEHWIVSHFLNDVVRAQLVGKQRQFAFNVI
jgi:hypothetical protein